MISLFNSLKTHLPFSYLNEKELKKIESTSNITYFRDNDTVISTQQKPEAIYYIIKGIVESNSGVETLDLLYENDTFGAAEVLKGQLPDSNYIVKEELIAYEIPKETFLELCNLNSQFKNYFFATIVERMELIQKERQKEVELNTLMAKADAIKLKKAVILERDSSVEDAIASMQESKAIAIIVNNKEGYGIVTDADFREYILNRDNISSISDIQSFPIVSASSDELLFNIQLLMSKKSIKHMPIVDDNGAILGIIEVTDILSYFSNQSHILSSSIEKATNLEYVVDISKSLHKTIKVLHSKGVKARYIAKVVSEINKKMYQKIFEFIFPEEWQDMASLVLLGSEGRGEQIVRTDQDNALIFKDSEAKDVAYYTQKFVATLDEIGYPRCSGNVMVINPKWAKSLQEYKDDIKVAIEKPTGESMLDLAIIYDSFSVAGNKTLLLELKEFLQKEATSNSSFLAHFAKPIESFESPLGLFSRFLPEAGHKDEVDIKKGAIFAMVHGVRTLALEYKITKTNTNERVKELSNIGYFNKELAIKLIEALEILNNIRLHFQLQKIEQNKELDNFVKLNELTKIERDSLKEAIREVQKFKKLIVYHSKLELL